MVKMRSKVNLMRDWRGSPTATSHDEAIRVFELAKLTRRDVFCDLGCGDGWVCIWAARRCKSAIGIESHPIRFRRAKKNVERKALQNVQIIRARFENVTLPTKNLVMYSTMDLGLEQFVAWNSKAKRNRKAKRNCRIRIVTVGPPPIPVKPLASKGRFYLTRFPYSKVRTGDEWCNSVVSKKGANLQDVRRRLRGWLKNDALRDLESNYRKYFKQSSN